MDNVTLLLRLSPRQAELLQKTVASMTPRELEKMLSDMSWEAESYANGQAPSIPELQGLLADVFAQTVNVVGMRL